jgi:hypothetical protein
MLTIKGTARIRETVDTCEDVAAAIPGVVGVTNQLTYVPEYVGA